MAKRNKNDLKITQEDLKKIYGRDCEFFQKKILNNCYCGNCKGPYNATITDYEIFLNDLNDILLRGKCKICGGPVGRYVETGEVPIYAEAIKKVRSKYEAN